MLLQSDKEEGGGGGRGGPIGQQNILLNFNSPAAVCFPGVFKA